VDKVTLPRHPSAQARSLRDFPRLLLATVQLRPSWVVPALDTLRHQDSHLSAQLSHLPRQLTVRRHLLSCHRLLRHTLQHLPTIPRRLQICTSHRPVQTTLRRHPATLQLPPITVHLRLISLERRYRQALDYPQPVLSTARAVRTSLRRAPNTREPSLLQNTLRHLPRTHLLVPNSHQRMLRSLFSLLSQLTISRSPKN
jgi:hypothetical protein